MKAELKLIGLLLALFACSVIGQRTKLPSPGVGLTIYNDNFAVVKERREIEFNDGIESVKFTDVASSIDPTSVNFKCLSAPDAVSILEQNYEYDLVNTSSLLKRYIDRPVTVQIKGSGADIGTQMSGVLSAAVSNDLILRNEETGSMEIISRGSLEHISLKEMPDDLITKPTLVWLCRAREKAKQLCQITYTTDDINWKADYTAVLNETDDMLDLTGWVTIDNKSGAAYKDATIKLIAGDVRRITEPRVLRQQRRLGMAMEKGADIGFQEKPFMEYHMYTLGRESTINNNQIKQIELIEPAKNVPAKKIYVYERQKKNDKVQVKIEFENKEENHLGIALPKGKVRVFKKDQADGMLEFVGEDAIDHTARNEKLSLYIGDAFDIVPEHTMTDTKRGRRMYRQSHKIELRNRKKDQAVTVYVDEKFPVYVNWRIDSASHSYKKTNAATARFEITVTADSTQTLEYTATQSW